MLGERFAVDRVSELAVNLISEMAAEFGVAAIGLYSLERAAGRAYRWTTGEAGLSVPLNPDAPPAALTVEVLMTGQPKALRIEVDGCVLFDDTVRNRWAQRFALDGCRLTSPALEIKLVSDTHVPDSSDNRTLGVGVSAIQLHGP